VAMATQYGSSRLNSMTVWSDEVAAETSLDEDADELEAEESAAPTVAR
jgi:hypothetical protein